MELKNPADEAADLWKAYDQIQTYKEQIPERGFASCSWSGTTTLLF